MEKTYQKLIQYVKEGVLNGQLRPGDRLPAERELAEKLSLSRNSVREGLRLLTFMGVLSSVQGSGNYISLEFDRSMTEVLSFMYFLKGIREAQVTEFRRMIEMEAYHLAVGKVSAEDKERLKEALAGLQQAETEYEQVRYDRTIHAIIVGACGNEFLISNYAALTNLMDTYIRTMRLRIIQGMQTRHRLEEAHRLLVEGILEENEDKGLEGLREHFDYIEQFQDNPLPGQNSDVVKK